MKSYALAALVAVLFATAAFAAEPALQKVESKKVCMINEQVFEKDQIAVEVEGKTYYGCCEMCRKALASDASKRAATDPVSGKKVDKSLAIIGALADGSVLYFENQKNFDTYAAQLAKKK
jgi:YHS domain-containing protein